MDYIKQIEICSLIKIMLDCKFSAENAVFLLHLNFSSYVIYKNKEESGTF